MMTHAVVQKKSVAALEPVNATITQLTLTDYLMVLAAAELESRRRELDAVQHGTITLTLEIKGGTINLLEVVLAETKTKHSLDDLFSALALRRAASPY